MRIVKTGSDAACACVVDLLMDADVGVTALATTTVDVTSLPRDAAMLERTKTHTDIMRDEVLIDKSVPWYARLLRPTPPELTWRTEKADDDRGNY